MNDRLEFLKELVRRKIFSEDEEIFQPTIKIINNLPVEEFEKFKQYWEGGMKLKEISKMTNLEIIEEIIFSKIFCFDEYTVEQYEEIWMQTTVEILVEIRELIKI